MTKVHILIKHFSTQAHTFDKAYIEAFRIPRGTFMTLLLYHERK